MCSFAYFIYNKRKFRIFLNFLMCERFTHLLRKTSDATEEQFAMMFHTPQHNKQNIFLPLHTKSPCRSTSFRSFCIFRSFAAPERRKLVVFLIYSPVHDVQRYYMPQLPISFSLCNLPQNVFRLKHFIIQQMQKYIILRYNWN